FSTVHTPAGVFMCASAPLLPQPTKVPAAFVTNCAPSELNACSALARSCPLTAKSVGDSPRCTALVHAALLGEIAGPAKACVDVLKSIAPLVPDTIMPAVWLSILPLLPSE